jgi:N-acetylglucosamine-6-sulfatase
MSGALAACTSNSPTAGTAGGSAKTNVVFVLTDDLAVNLVQYMPHVQALAKGGTTFSNYTVTDSLCCPSRTSIFTGKFPHDSGVFTNTGKDGGYATFNRRGNQNSTFATDLQKAGYQTAFMGKYLNGYTPKADNAPPGWTEWDVAGNGYPEFNYDLNENGQIKHYGKAPADYLTDVVSAKASTFITSSATAKKPFMLEVATFAPHAPYTPAPQDKDKFPGLQAPRGPAFDQLPANAPKWLASRAKLTADETKAIDNAFRKRVQAVQSVDRMIGSLRATLTKAGIADKTVVVFSSDNGYHMGEYRLTPGKQTAFDTDIHVPLVMSGPGVKAGAVVAQPAENVDLRPTFDSIAGASAPAEVDGHTLLPLLKGQQASDWRQAALIEHHGPDTDPADPDNPPKNSGNPTTYEAMRTATFTYVEYADGELEYYDRGSDPNELKNVAGSLDKSKLSQLHDQLAKLKGCHGQSACWAAAQG